MTSKGVTHARNTSGLLASSKAKSTAKHERGTQVIDELWNGGKTVNFNAVSQAAGCTKSYLYAHSDLRERVDTSRQRQAQARLTLVSGPVREQARTDKSKDVIIAVQAKRLKEMEAELKRLKADNKKLYGEAYEKL